MTAIATHRPTTPYHLVVRWDRVALALAVLLTVAWLLTGVAAGHSQAATAPADPIAVVVQPGDTLWQLARDHAPAGMATLEYAALVEQANDVRAGRLLPGTPLQLPQP